MVSSINFNTGRHDKSYIVCKAITPVKRTQFLKFSKAYRAKYDCNEVKCFLFFSRHCNCNEDRNCSSGIVLVNFISNCLRLYQFDILPWGIYYCKNLTLNCNAMLFPTLASKTALAKHLNFLCNLLKNDS